MDARCSCCVKCCQVLELQLDVQTSLGTVPRHEAYANNAEAHTHQYSPNCRFGGALRPVLATVAAGHVAKDAQRSQLGREQSAPIIGPHEGIRASCTGTDTFPQLHPPHISLS